MKIVGSEYREPSALPDGQYPDISGVPSPTAADQRGTPSGSERIEEPSYREHGISPSGQQPAEAPSFYPADLPDRQLQEEQRQTPVVQPQQRNGAYPSYGQRQQPYNPAPSMPSQGSTPPVPNPLYPQYPPQGPSGQPYRGAPAGYTNPQTYQYPPNGFIQPPPQPVYPGNPPGRPVQQPPVYPGYPYAQQPGYYPPPYGYQGYPVYPGYPPYPYAWYPPRPRRNGYQLGMAIVSLVGSILAIIGGALCGLALLGLNFDSIPTITNATLARSIFAAAILYTGLMVAGVVGGAFGVYHSARALGRQPSRLFKLPPFWVFLLFYVVLVVVGFLVGSSSVVINDLFLVFLLIALSGISPALTFLAFALRRVRRKESKKASEWPTTWRRFTLALVSGATLAILIAIILELILTVVAILQSGVVNLSSIDNPTAPTSHDPKVVFLTLVIVSVIAPIVEESFKPLAVVIMIGRLRSAAEAFILGMACGIGFDMIETTEYMGTGYKSWASVAIDRSTAGLLHGFGAGMMALGWYYITHKDALKSRNIQIGLGCMLYAILQHAIWNGSFVLQLLPAPIGPYLTSGTIPIFGYQLDAFLIVYIVFSILILSFLWFVTGKIRLQPDVPSGNTDRPGNQANQASANQAPMKIAPAS